jgi:hypothetical protein
MAKKDKGKGKGKGGKGRKKNGKSADEHGTKDVSGALSQISDGDWDGTDANEGFADVDNDKYRVRIKEAKLNNSKSSGRFQCSWTLEILSGQSSGEKFKGRNLFKHDGLEDEQQRGFFRNGLERLGVEWPKKSKLPATLEALKGTFALVSAKKKGDFMNTYFDKALDSDEAASGTVETVDDDPAEIEVGSKVTWDDDGDEETGEVVKIKGKKATVKDDDGEKHKLKLADLTLVDGDEKGEDGDGDGDVTLKFDDDDLEKKHKKAIKKLAKKHEFDPDDYETLSELAADIAESLEIEDEFDDADELLEAIDEADDD